MAEFPFCLLSSRATKQSESVIGYERETTLPNGRTVRMRFEVSGGKHGLPCGGDQDIYVAIMAAWARSSFQSKVIEFPSVYALLQSVDVQPDGRGYERVKTAFEKLCGILCTSEKSWWDVKSRQRKSAVGFHLFESFYLNKRKERNNDDNNDINKDSPCYIVASDFFYESVRNGNIKTFDIELYKKLATPLSKRLYRYLDQMRRVSRSRKWSIALKKIQGVLPLSPDFYPSQVKRELEDGLRDLMKKGFLKTYSFLQNEDRAHLLQIEFAKTASKTALITTDEEIRRESLAQELAAELNDHRSKAYYLKLTKCLPEDYLFRALSETRDAKNRGQIRTTPARFFTEFVERNYQEILQITDEQLSFIDGPRVS